MSVQAESVFNTKIGANLDAVLSKKEPILTFGQFVKAKRNKLNLSIHRLAKSIGVHDNTILRVESCSSISSFNMLTIKKFIDFFSIKQEDMELVKGKPNLTKYFKALPLNQIEAKNRLSLALQEINHGENAPKEPKLPRTFTVKPEILIVNILKDLKSYLIDAQAIEKKGILFDQIKKTSIDCLERSMALLEDIEIFDTFVKENRPNKPEL